ncbi:hypothetical protein C8R43DRAFT_993360 [Mycena crocata]|nr:hypothetical protein C8R43DRAFT_993360 [Mycena crocata]
MPSRSAAPSESSASATDHTAYTDPPPRRPSRDAAAFAAHRACAARTGSASQGPSERAPAASSTPRRCGVVSRGGPVACLTASRIAWSLTRSAIAGERTRVERHYPVRVVVRSLGGSPCGLRAALRVRPVPASSACRACCVAAGESAGGASRRGELRRANRVSRRYVSTDSNNRRNGFM